LLGATGSGTDLESQVPNLERRDADGGQTLRSKTLWEGTFQFLDLTSRKSCRLGGVLPMAAVNVLDTMLDHDTSTAY
jgi:hypothetical protein